MLQLVFKSRLVKAFTTMSFIIATVLFGFSSYTSQKMAEATAPNIFHNPSRLTFSEIVYIPQQIVEQSEAFPDFQHHLIITLRKLYEKGVINQVICGEQLYIKLIQQGVSAVNYTGEDKSIHEEMMRLLDQYPTSSILLIANRNYLEQGLYALGSMGGKGTGLEVEYGSQTNEVAHYLARVKLYFDCELSKPNPLIANPRYTLDIQH